MRLPLDWPPLREAAEGIVSEIVVLDPVTTDRDREIHVQSLLLADLTRPASRDHWYRWIVQRDDIPTTWRDNIPMLYQILITRFRVRYDRLGN